MFFRSVASITNSLAKITKRLEAHNEAQLAKHDWHRNKAAEHVAHSDAAYNEAAKAREVAAKIEALIS